MDTWYSKRKAEALEQGPLLHTAGDKNLTIERQPTP